MLGVIASAAMVGSGTTAGSATTTGKHTTDEARRMTGDSTILPAAGRMSEGGATAGGPRTSRGGRRGGGRGPLRRQARRKGRPGRMNLRLRTTMTMSCGR